MERRGKKCNRHRKGNNQSHNRFGNNETRQSNNSDNDTFNFRHRNEQSESLNYYNQKEQRWKRYDSGNSREQLENRPIPSNKQEQRYYKQNPQRKTFDNAFNENENKSQIEIKKFCFGYKRLEELCKKNVSEILFVMQNRTNGFMDLFKQDNKPDWIVLLMNVSAKICSTEFIQSKTLLITELTCNIFLNNLKTYILSTPTEKNPNRCNNMDAFFADCLVVFQCITILFPKTAVEKLKEIVVSSNIALTGINNYCDYIKINETTKSEMSELLQRLNDIELTKEMVLKEKIELNNIAQYFPPPENFRELTVYPTAIDLELGIPFLRPNIVKGVYQNVEHYLDVQFRLLREDFIAPLREGINSYKERIINIQQSQHRRKINNIRIYSNVEFEKKGEFVYDKSGFIINFNKLNKLKINWEMAKRFMYGSLLLFTVNEFKTFFLGVVLERKLELLKQGKLIVELLDDATPLYNTSFTMVESEVFFEPYKCSMEVLKNINSKNFPMEKYIIKACNQIDYPLYIDTLPESDKHYLIDDLNKFHILLNDTWPTKEQLGLDEMQYGAFKAALTNEFTVIQGPPGTGKTFIGLKIMKTILNNLYTEIEISKKLTKPILVICYTNHALDQFMEGILNFTNKVVRIGGQSKSEIIEKYSLRNITRMYKRCATTNIGLRNIRERVKTIMNDVKYFRKCSDVVSYNAGILELSLLKNAMPIRYHKFFKTTLDLLSWLFQDFNRFSVDPVGFLNVTNNELINKVYHSEQLLKINNYDDIHQVEDDDNLQYEADDLDLEYNYKDIIIYSITLDDIKYACKELLSESIKLEGLLNENINLFNESEAAKINFDIMEKIHDYFEDMLSIANSHINLPKQIPDLNVLDMAQRWALYFCWVKNLKEMFGPKIMKLEQKYTKLYKQYTELKELENIEILNKMNVIALTTTGAAKHRIMLEGLESPIVIVEEAAEVLEAHIVSSLTKHCQHLILIGDHKQLRPSTSVYKLAKDYNFDISLFERMVNNNVPCYTLGEQHRMRPEIALLVSPTIYPQLKNHNSVYNRDHIQGVAKDLFFLNHNIYEKEIEEISSKCNEHEATFLIMFARHLLLQGYRTDQVTILTTYSGQLFQLRSLRKQHQILEGMRITVVDNYQGEESDIILLSLVRSNEKGNVGFLKIENRICVALSRAKYGLYIMGNMDNLCNSSDMWKQIKQTLINQNSYGDQLILKCAIHSEITTKVLKSDDFSCIMEGGCTMLCNSLLSCGHYCTSICHPYDRDHVKTICREPCNKSCYNNHPCTKTCSMDCGKCTVPMLKELPCGHQSIVECYVDTATYLCEEKVETLLVQCGHTIIKKCHETEPNCTFKCFDRLVCGHACKRNCHKNDDPDHEEYKCLKPCEKMNSNCTLNHQCKKLCYEDCSNCTVKIKEKTLPCGHKKYNIPCGLNVNDIKCNSPCDRLMPCNHKCQDQCLNPCKPCEIQVKKIIPECGHSIKIKCKSTPTRRNCTEICNQTLDCGHKCKKSCAKQCTTEDCDEIVLIKNDKLACGHNNVWVLCCDRDKEFRMDSQYLLDKCQEPCQQKLSCNDICQGTCGQCKQGRLHIPCNEICNKINPCNHTCKFPCKERCPPCNQECLYSCVHSKCTAKCGNNCVTCKEKCNWQCRHLSCTKKCDEKCNRPPCYEPCDLILQCGHECIGFCGEPCPPLCRICNRDEVTAIVFGNEDEPDARFVYLNDCKHTIESDALQQWMNQNDEEITLKQCPLCKTPILKTQRFMNQVKVILEDISKIKKKQNGEIGLIKLNKKRIIKTLNNLNNNFDTNFIGGINKYKHIKNVWTKFCKPLINSMNYKGNKQLNFSLNSKDIESLDFVISLFKVTSKYQKRIQGIIDEKKTIVINHFVWLLYVAFSYARQLSSQQKIDINMEMARGARMIHLYEIMSNTDYKVKVQMQTSYAKEVKELVSNMEALLMSCSIYTMDRDEEIQNLTELIKQKIDGIEIITDEERKMIHEAMSINFQGGIRAQGHWCKCPNGHIYCVTECGGPMEQSFCPECKVAIGGQDHRHVYGVTVASEMDGAERLVYPAY